LNSLCHVGVVVDDRGGHRWPPNALLGVLYFSLESFFTTEMTTMSLTILMKSNRTKNEGKKLLSKQLKELPPMVKSSTMFS